MTGPLVAQKPLRIVSSAPYHVIREMTPKGNVIRECTEI